MRVPPLPGLLQQTRTRRDVLKALAGLATLGMAACVAAPSDRRGTSSTAGAGSLSIPATAPGSRSGAAAASPVGRLLVASQRLDALGVAIAAGATAFARYANWELRLAVSPDGVNGRWLATQLEVDVARPGGIVYALSQPGPLSEVLGATPGLDCPLLVCGMADPEEIARAQRTSDAPFALLGQDPLGAGIANGLQAARFAHWRGRSEGTIAIVSAGQGDRTLQRRARGTALGIERYNREHGTWFHAQALALPSGAAEALALLDATWSAPGTRIVGLAATDASHALAGQLVLARGLKKAIAVGGFDLAPPVLDGIAGGAVDWTIGENGYAQGWLAAALLHSGGWRDRAAIRSAGGFVEVVTAESVERVVARLRSWQLAAAEVGFA